MMSRNLSIAFLTLILLGSQSTTLVAAETQVVHVLGSFSSEPNARNESKRLSTRLNADVTVHFDASQSVYRVIVDADVIDPDLLADIPSWLLPIIKTPVIAGPPTEEAPAKTLANAPTKEPGAEIQLNPALVTEQTVKVTTEQPMGPLYPAFEPGETLSAYCDRLPTSRLCEHPRMQRAIEQDRKLTAHRAAVENACLVISNTERRETCQKLREEELP